MNVGQLESALKILKKEIMKWKQPVVGVIADEAIDRPFETLISCLLSLRTKDAVTDEASRRLFAVAKTPQDLTKLPEATISKLIYPVGFYKTKAKNIKRICTILIEKHGGKVPRSLEALLEFPGVGRKTANLVITVGYDDYGICVDTHVHRISNRLGFVKTKTPEDTEFALRKKLPKKHWKTYNDILVTYGQNLCVPISPWCSRCAVANLCEKRGVTTRR